LEGIFNGDGVSQLENTPERWRLGQSMSGVSGEIMPISSERKKLYPDNWDKISLLVREKAGWKCELCFSKQSEPQIATESMVVLTVHHINNDPTDNRKINLIALCQRCHNRLDMPFRRKKKKEGELI